MNVNFINVILYFLRNLLWFLPILLLGIKISKTNNKYENIEGKKEKLYKITSSSYYLLFLIILFLNFLENIFQKSFSYSLKDYVYNLSFYDITYYICSFITLISFVLIFIASKSKKDKLFNCSLKISIITFYILVLGLCILSVGKVLEYSNLFRTIINNSGIISRKDRSYIIRNIILTIINLITKLFIYFNCIDIIKGLLDLENNDYRIIGFNKYIKTIIIMICIYAIAKIGSSFANYIVIKDQINYTDEIILFYYVNLNYSYQYIIFNVLPIINIIFMKKAFDYNKNNNKQNEEQENYEENKIN